jgi:hypothetical protein
MEDESYRSFLQSLEAYSVILSKVGHGTVKSELLTAVYIIFALFCNETQYNLVDKLPTFQSLHLLP